MKFIVLLYSTVDKEFMLRDLIKQTSTSYHYRLKHLF